MHPDGAMFPALTGQGQRLSDLQDGTSHTVLCAETQDTNASSWMRGEETTLYGLPTAGGCGGGGCASVSSNGQITSFVQYANYYAPLHFNGTMDDQWNTQNNTPPYRTFLSFDFTPNVGADKGCFALPWAVSPGNPNSSGSTQFLYGPGSAHAVVMHGMGDGSVQAFAKSMDPAAYMFVITRSGQDPDGVPK
jgi:hypothetical protein